MQSASDLAKSYSSSNDEHGFLPLLRGKTKNNDNFQKIANRKGNVINNKDFQLNIPGKASEGKGTGRIECLTDEYRRKISTDTTFHTKKTYIPSHENLNAHEEKKQLSDLIDESLLLSSQN